MFKLISNQFLRGSNAQVVSTCFGPDHGFTTLLTKGISDCLKSSNFSPMAFKCSSKGKLPFIYKKLVMFFVLSFLSFTVSVET